MSDQDAVEDTGPATVKDLVDINESMREIGKGIGALASSISEDTKRKRRTTNRLLGVLLLFVAGSIGFQVYTERGQADDKQALKDFVAQVSESNQADLQAAIDRLAPADDPQRIKKSDLLVIVCDIDPDLCAPDGTYVGR